MNQGVMIGTANVSHYSQSTGLPLRRQNVQGNPPKKAHRITTTGHETQRSASPRSRRWLPRCCARTKKSHWPKSVAFSYA